MKHTTPARAPSRAHWKRVLLALLAVAVAFVAAPAPAAQTDINVYTTPGNHTVNGRKWHTACEPYSSVIDRCRAEIWAPRPTYVNGRYVTTTGWVFNNQTHLPAPRAAWAGNPLATPGEHTIAGRKWKTECDTAWTGQGACRSSIWATVIESTKSASGVWTFAPVTRWVFSSIVLFTPDPAGTCPGAALPENFAITNGKPHQVKVPYPDSTLYNPTSISNFIRKTLADGRNSPAQQTCLATLGGNTLIDGGVRKPTPDGKSALWFNYLFPYSANPATDTLQPGWISGLSQGVALNALSLLHDRTGDPKWLAAATETFESYTVPLALGGFAHEVNGALWFEEYPTKPVPTTVLNGHLEAVIALDVWQRHSGDPRATALFKRAIAGLKKIIPDEYMPVSQGMLSSYDQLRGHEVAPLRLASGSKLTVQSATQDLPGGAKRITLPVQGAVSDGPNLLTNSSFSTWSGGLPTGWVRTLGAASSVRDSGGSLSIKGAGTGWQSVSQTVPASKISAGTYRVSWKGRTTHPALQDGTSGRVIVVARCPSGSTVIGENVITRARALSQLDMLVQVPAAACDVQVILYQASSTDKITTVYFDDVTLSVAKPATGATQLTWPLSVQDAPKSVVTVTATGAGELQAYENGRWWALARWNSTTPTTMRVQVPERFTGRNISYTYHELHIEELLLIYRRTGDRFFLDTAQAWRPLAPGRESAFQNLATSPYVGCR